MKIRFLYFDGCPNVTPTIHLLRQILAEEKVDSEIEMVEINDYEMAKREHFPGSPTIQIDGKDIEDRKESSPATFGCRVYKTKDGLSGIPPEELIRNAIKSAKK